MLAMLDTPDAVRPLELLLYNFAGLVWDGTIGSVLVVKTILFIGFQASTLDTSENN
jgi:hypothetical protein